MDLFDINITKPIYEGTLELGKPFTIWITIDRKFHFLHYVLLNYNYYWT